MILLVNCPACSGSNLLNKLDCIDHSTSKEKFTIVSCETCDFTFTNPRPKDNSLEKYYKSDMYISHTNNTKGIEPSELARNQAIRNYNLSVSENTNLNQFKANQFDSISMWHVLEHVPSLNKTIEEINRILSKKGKVIIAVPNHKSWDAKYYKEFWAGWDVPIHLWHFSRLSIEKIFNNNNFKLVNKKPMIFDSFYVSILSEEFKTGKKKFIRGFITGLISNIVGIFSKRGYSSIIYVFEKQ